MDSTAILARNLELIRVAKEYTHENLALDADIARSHISNIENLSHSATLALVDRLAKTLEVEPWLLLVPDLQGGERRRSRSRLDRPACPA